VAFATLEDISLNLTQPPDLAALANTISAATNVSSSTLFRLFQLQYNLIGKLRVPDAELGFGNTMTIGLPVSNALFCAHWILMPFSRGNVHINSNDPLTPPSINPNYFIADYDMQVTIAIQKFLRKFLATEPIKNSITETNPGFSAVPEDASDDDWATWIKASCKFRIP
jgi:hypothetical protein